MSPVGQKIGRYRVEEKLGAGGMGQVYRAHDERLGRDVALKFLSEKYLSDEGARSRFETEARAASALDHQNICPVFDVGGVEDGQPYLVTGSCHGVTLERKLEKACALDPFEEALRLDPSFAPALSGLADSHLLLAVYSVAPAKDHMPRAAELSRRALALDPDLAEAHTSLGSVEALFLWDEKAAERSFRRAIESEPRSFLPRHSFAINLLAPSGRFDEAQEHQRIALGLDAKSVAINFGLAMTLYFRRDLPGAIEQFHATIDLDPGFSLARAVLAEVFVQQSRVEEALEVVEPILEASSAGEIYAILGYVLARMGREDAARESLERLLSPDSEVYVSPYLPAIVHLGLGDHDVALDGLERALEARSPILVWLRHRPLFDPLRAEPRFEALLKQCGPQGQAPQANQ